ncbi:MAG: S-layer homology domain-containing protein [Bacillota bacterium]|nr:S-layer homology domain-containing protein [Bacillota bacterium]
MIRPRLLAIVYDLHRRPTESGGLWYGFHVRGCQRRLLAMFLFLALLLGGQAVGPSAAWSQPLSFSYFPPMPQGTVAVPRPIMALRLVVPEGEDPSLFRFFMSLDGVQVPAQRSGPYIWYQVDKDLTGWHTAMAFIALGSLQENIPWTFTVSPQTPPTLHPEPLLEWAQRTVNDIRRQGGLEPLQLDSSLLYAARSHALFFAENGSRYSNLDLTVHNETPGWPGFTGVQPWDRAHLFGYPGNVGEDMAFAMPPLEAADTWLASVYHRLPLLDPGQLAMGLEWAGKGQSLLPVTVLELGDVLMQKGLVARDVKSTVRIRYPQDQQTGVPLRFVSGEIPDPLSPFPGASYPAGYPITLQFPSLHVRQLQVGKASLKAGNQDVPFYLLAPDPQKTDPAYTLLGNAVALIPKAPLKPDTQYQVEIQGSYLVDSGQTQSFSERWSFRTARYEKPRIQTLYRSYEGDSLVALRLVLAGDGSQVQVLVDGKPAPFLRSGSGVLDVALPDGRYTPDSVLTVLQPDGQSASWPNFTGGRTTVVGNPPSPQMTVIRTWKGQEAGRALSQGGQYWIPVSLLEGAGLRWVPADDGYGAVARDRNFVMGLRVGVPLAWQPDGAGLVTLRLPSVPRVEEGQVYLPLEAARQTLGAVGRYLTLRSGVLTFYAYLADIEGNWSEGWVRDLVRRGVIHGFEDGLFHPQETISLAQWIKMLVAAQGLPLRPGDTGGLPLSKTQWLVQQGYLGAALQAGLVTQEDARRGLLRLDQPLTRVEALRYLQRLADLRGWMPAQKATPPFVDLAGLSPEALGWVDTFYNLGVLRGEPGPQNTLLLQPQRPLSRAEAAALLDRLLELP